MDLLVGTLTLRPYVFGFLAAFLGLALRDLGFRRTAIFSGWTFAVAWTAEFASTRIGFPFGLYHYTEATRSRELFISNVPFFDSLSFVFLAYAAYCLARVALRTSSGFGVVALAGLLMMLLDVVIDPLAVRGDRWFLGRVFSYPAGGVLFGVPLSNFAGWVLVGTLAVGGFVALRLSGPLGRPGGGVALYYGILAFNLAVAWWIDEPLLLGTGLLLHVSLCAALWSCYAVTGVRRRARPGAPRSHPAFD